MNKEFFVAIAYRGGSTNDHQYIVGASNDFQELDEQAALEYQNRGGKYGVAVYKIDNSMDEGCNMRNCNHQLMSYHYIQIEDLFPSKPEQDPIREAAKDIGFHVIEVCKFGGTWMPPKDGSTQCIHTKIQPPEWLSKLCKDKINKAEQIAEILNNRKEYHKVLN